MENSLFSTKEFWEHVADRHSQEVLRVLSGQRTSAESLRRRNTGIRPIILKKFDLKLANIGALEWLLLGAAGIRSPRAHSHFEIGLWDVPPDRIRDAAKEATRFATRLDSLSGLAVVRPDYDLEEIQAWLTFKKEVQIDHLAE